MGKNIILIIIMTISMNLWANIEHHGTKVTWKKPITSNQLDFDKLTKSLEKALNDLAIITAVNKISERQISSEINSDLSKIVVKELYYFATTNIPVLSEMFLTFEMTYKDCSTSSNLSCKDEVTYKLVNPFHAYTRFFDFRLANLKISSLSLKITVGDKRNENNVVISGKRELRVEFDTKDHSFLNWLERATQILKLQEKPTAQHLSTYSSFVVSSLGNSFSEILN